MRHRYTEDMSGFIKAFEAAVPQTKESGYVAILYAALLTGMVVAQLFTFEDFIILFQDMFGRSTGMIVAALIVVIEVFALPFLLRIPLSKAFRYFSLGLAGIAAVFWLFVTTWEVIVKPSVTATGLLGTLDPLGPGAWAISFTSALTVLAVWSIWGLLPAHRAK
jgi:hypothetical protein